MSLRQIRIDRHVEAGRASFDAAQHQVLHGIEADCSTRDGVAHRGRDLIGAEHLHQSQNLDELALALLTHPGGENADDAAQPEPPPRTSVAYWRVEGCPY